MAYSLNDLISKASNHEKMKGVHPLVKEKFLQVVTRAYNELGYKLVLAEGYRSVARQNELYAQGRTKKYDENGKRLYIVTNARGGSSYHNFGLAVDFAVLDPKNENKLDYTDSKYRQVGKIGKALGLEWGGDWKKIYDAPHFQITFGLTLAQLRAGAKPPKGSTEKPASSPKLPEKHCAVDDLTPLVPYPGILKQGSKGINVKRVQRAAGMPESLIDGVYGARTKSYVQAYQTKHKLVADGITGLKTWNMMF
ncbi:endolysin [Bacillus phage Pascal]|uniref:Peptidase n=1 Tax=Bacillus phage Pascal TaxID=1540092 RepID=A0A0A0RNQ7_9CAUD|nr:endolysin [Bacillus phage Pascal]AIW03657.1 peptidase [Bacillus phage Pascal]